MSDPICASELLRWHPDGEALFILCQNTSVIEWRIYENQQKEWTHINAREMIISDDGNFLLSADNEATISVWNFSRLSLIYRVVTESDDEIVDLAFSPSSQRFYVVRGSVCNGWEPDAFLVTALALDAENWYYCCGREDGRVSIHDVVSGKRLRKLYSHGASATVLDLCWSVSGNYLVSSDDVDCVITKRLQLKPDGTWAVFPVFDCQLDEPVKQFLFSSGERFLLIMTPSDEHIWGLRTKKEVKTQRRSERQSRRWIQYPLQNDFPLCITAREVRCHKWPSLEAVHNAVITRPSPVEILPADDSGPSTGSNLQCREPSRFVSWAIPNPVNKHSILYVTLPGDDTLVSSRHSHSGLHLESVDSFDKTPGITGSKSSQPANGRCASRVAEQIRQPLGTYKTSLVFLDHADWLCTWDMLDETGHVVKHFFVPKDWLNTSESHKAMVKSHGTFFCPRYGDVAIVRNGIRI
ncbi:WD40-repeat-containing domain protein [Achaetomium macrosporum]|uniref:WD40-repeat-containing domain protein n=1 Tax=Achaetomium macrosporum TaxID=79813 RepID=A0AAN7CB93_9PEZI|nr:WD40-repeat-containing domain protein [Achaetomium macrosporum]